VLREPGVGSILLWSACSAVMGIFIFLMYSVPVTTRQMGIDASLVPLASSRCSGAVLAQPRGRAHGQRDRPWRTQLRVLVATIISLLAVPIIAYLPMPVRLVAFLLDLFVFGVVTWGFFRRNCCASWLWRQARRSSSRR